VHGAAGATFDGRASMSRDDKTSGPRLVPAYAITGGRTRSAGADLPWETMVVTTEAGIDNQSKLRFEQARIVAHCRRAMSIVEIAARLRVPPGVASVLVSDLHSHGYLEVHRPVLTDNGRPGADVLQRLLTGLREQSRTGQP
jgi:hypothetical protein